MADVEIRNILLTPYSTLSVFGDDNTHKFREMYSVDQEILDIDISNSMEYTEYSFMNKVLVTSESVLKYLVLPKQNKMLESPIKLDKVFAFTTDEVSKPTDGLKRYAVDEVKIIHKYVDSVSVEEFVSDEDFISSRMQAIYDYAQGNPLGTRELKIEPVPIENEKDGIEQNLNNIFDMVDNIIEYIENSKENNVEVRVYVDMTGGFRTIPMYLLFILNILEKRGIIMEKVYYAQMSSEEKGTQKIQKIQIDDLTQVLKTQDFTNGIHEFIKFGSAQELSVFLNKDLEKDANPEHRRVIKNFVKSVESFAEAITISHRTKFEESIDQIKSTWMDLGQINIGSSPIVSNKEKSLSSNENNENNENNEKINLLKIFEPRIYKEYKLVWDNPTHLSYIKWCLEHNFIQQALTLYIELVPEIFFETSDDIDANKNSLHIMQVLNEDDLKSSWGKSEYKFKYWLLNQYNVNVDAIRLEQAKNEITPERNMCKEILIRFSQRNPNEWTDNPGLTIKEFFEKSKESFAEKIEEKYSNGKEDINLNFNFEDTSWKMSTLNQSKFESNWKNLIELFSSSSLLCDFCVNVLDFLLYSIKSEKWNSENIKCVSDITEKLGEYICKLSNKPNLLKELENDKQRNQDNIIDNNLNKINVMDTYMYPFGYGCLKNKLQEKLSIAIINNINNTVIKRILSETPKVSGKFSIDNYIKELIVKNSSYIFEAKNNVDYKEVIKDTIELLKQEIKELVASKKHYNLRKLYIRVSDVKDDILENILLPRNINKIEFAEFPELGNEIASMDKYAKVNDIENLVVNNKVRIDQKILNAFMEKQKDFKLDVRDILKLIQSLEGYNKEKAEKILKQYLQIIPESIGGHAAPKDMWGRDTLTLLILRILLYPYNILKLIRNDSVHAREERNLNVTRDDIRRLIEKSIGTIEKYLDVVK